MDFDEDVDLDLDLDTCESTMCQTVARFHFVQVQVRHRCSFATELTGRSEDHSMAVGRPLDSLSEDHFVHERSNMGPRERAMAKGRGGFKNTKLGKNVYRQLKRRGPPEPITNKHQNEKPRRPEKPANAAVASNRSAKRFDK